MSHISNCLRGILLPLFFFFLCLDADTTLFIQDNDSGELTLENTNTRIRKANPVPIPPTEESTAKE